MQKGKIIITKIYESVCEGITGYSSDSATPGSYTLPEAHGKALQLNKGLVSPEP